LPSAYVERVTRAKVRAARRRLKISGLPEAPILCSDTTVALGRRILGKPRDAAHAISILSLLSNRTHRVLTAVAVSKGPRLHMAVSTSHVRFAPLPIGDIQAYVASGEPFGKAGAYAIQSAAAAWISHITGSYSGIMGLPLFETAQLLRRCVIVAQTPSA
jgi:septum formation protein